MADSNESYTVYRGSALPIGFVLNDSNGDVQTNIYDGTEDLSAVLWPGGSRAASFAPAVAWDVAADATGIVTVSEAQRHARPRRLSAPGVGHDLRRPHGRRIQLRRDGAPRRRHRDRAVELLHLRRPARIRPGLAQAARGRRGPGRVCPTAASRPGLDRGYRARPLPDGHPGGGRGGAGLGPRRGSARSTWLQEQLDADTLMVTDQVRECAAMRALRPDLCRPDRGGREYGLRPARPALLEPGELPRRLPGALARHRRRRRARRDHRLHL